jgi:hypothetical protein
MTASKKQKPELIITEHVDELWIKPPNWSVNGNGIVGYGRLLNNNNNA